MTTQTTTARTSARIGPATAGGIDALAVLVFAATGRASHSEAVLPGLLRTAWPFLAALAVGWLIVRALGVPGAGPRAGLVVWVATVAGGMLLRAASGQGTATAFIIVATVVLGCLLVGWRLIAGLRRPS